MPASGPPPPRPSRSASEVARSRLSAVSHTRPNHSLVQSRGHAFFLSLVLDRHDYRVKACVHRRYTGRTSRTLLCCLSVLSATSPRLGLVSSRGLRPAIALSREGLARVWIRPRRGRRAALARWQGRVSAVSHTRRASSHERRYQCTAIYYCCWASCRTCLPQTA